MIRLRKNISLAPRGTSLIEMLTAIAIAGAVLGITGKLFYTLLTGRGDGRQALEQRLSDARLAEEFRRDVHEANAADTAADGSVPRLLLTQYGERAVEYRFEHGALIRRETQAEKLVRREVYRFKTRNDVRFEIETAGEASLVRIAWKETVPPSGMSSEGTSAAREKELMALLRRNVVEPIRVAAKNDGAAEATGVTP